jgi:hypothetical protein
MKIYFAAFVWGEKYIKDFLAMTLPSQLTISNIPSVQGTIKYIFYIKKNERYFFDVKIVEDLKLFCDVNFEFIDDISIKNNKYNNLGLIQNRAITHAVIQGFDVFFPIYSDLIFSSNAIPYTIKKITEGKYFVFSMAPQVIRNNLATYLESKPNGKNQEVKLDPVEMTKFVVNNLHPIRAPSVFRDGEFTSFPSVFFIKTPEGLIGKAFHLHPVAFRITKDKILTNKFIGTLDEHFIPLLIDRIELAHVIDNTADMILCSFDEYDGKNTENDNLYDNLADRDKIINIAERHTSKIHRQFFEKNIYFNLKGPVSKITNDLRIELDGFTNSILRELAISNDQLKSYSFETYSKREFFFFFKKKAIEYQIQQELDLFKSIFIWKIIKNSLVILHFFKINSLKIYEKRKKIKQNVENFFPFMRIETISKIYGAEVLKYAQGQSLTYLFYIIYIKLKR